MSKTRALENARVRDPTNHTSNPRPSAGACPLGFATRSNPFMRPPSPEGRELGRRVLAVFKGAGFSLLHNPVQCPHGFVSINFNAFRGFPDRANRLLRCEKLVLAAWIAAYGWAC